jgi:hypothetical protein
LRYRAHLGKELVQHRQHLVVYNSYSPASGNSRTYGLNASSSFVEYLILDLDSLPKQR